MATTSPPHPANAKETSEGSPACAGPSSRRASPVARPRRILIVDDEPLVGRAMARLLGGAGHDVTICTRPADGLEAILGGLHFDVILCDIMMPQVSGMDFHRTLRESVPEQARRVVFVTGGSPDLAVDRFLCAVPNACLRKPFEAHELLSIVQQTMDAQRRLEA